MAIKLREDKVNDILKTHKITPHEFNKIFMSTMRFRNVNVEPTSYLLDDYYKWPAGVMYSIQESLEKIENCIFTIGDLFEITPNKNKGKCSEIVVKLKMDRLGSILKIHNITKEKFKNLLDEKLDMKYIEFPDIINSENFSNHKSSLLFSILEVLSKINGEYRYTMEDIFKVERICKCEK